MRECPECGTELREGQENCPGCGRRGDGGEEATRTCEKCGEEILARADACPVCGRLRDETPCERHGERLTRDRCVICGTVVCEECNRGDGVPAACERHATIPVIEGWAQVYTTNDEVEAQLIRDNIEAEGIDAQVFSQRDHFSFTVHLGDLSPVRILVPAYAYQDAREVIQSRMDARGEVGFACPACGEPFERREASCSACGQPLAS